jgi:hypothetical protein
MNALQFAIAAMSGALGAPNIISIDVDDTTSRGYSDSTGGFIFHNNGSISRYISGVPIVVGSWISPLSNFDQYEIKATLDSGDTPTSGTLATWESLDTTRFWTIVNDDTSDTSNLTLEIRWTGNNEVQDTASVVIESTSVAES